MTGAGLFPGDIGVVDRSRVPTDGSIILALLDGQSMLKRYRAKSGRVWLQAENPAFEDIQLGSGAEFEVWGVVTSSVRRF